MDSETKRSVLSPLTNQNALERAAPSPISRKPPAKEGEECSKTQEPDVPSVSGHYGTAEVEDTEEVLGASFLNQSVICYDNAEEALQESGFGLLPNEITQHVLRNLEVEDLKSSFLVCRMWALERFNEQIWKTVVFRSFMDWASLKPTEMTWKMLALACNATDPHEGARLGRLQITSATGGEYVGALLEGEPHGLGVMRYEAGHVYSGSWRAGLKAGSGRYVWKNGNVYTGDWEDDKQTGLGEFHWNDGDHYKGEWKNDHRHGKGVYTWPKGSFYEGEFSMNDLHNFGRYTWKNGYYEGGWKNSTRHGKGTIKWTNGNSFEGEFSNNAKSGYGVYRWSDGATYSGNWKADDRSGKAVTQWANGMSYVGQYVRDLRNGDGVLKWPDKSEFRGAWKNGGRFGKGTFTDAEGQTHEQVWREPEKIQYSKQIPDKWPK